VRARAGGARHRGGRGIGPTRSSLICARARGPGGSARSRPTSGLPRAVPGDEIWGSARHAQKLSSAGYTRCGTARGRAEDLGAIVGRGAGAILEYARGADREPLRPKPRARSLSQERTLEEPLVDLRSLGELLELLAERLERALARERRAAQTVTLGVSFVDGSQVTKSRALPVPATEQRVFAEAGQELLSRTQAGARAVRRLRLGLSGLTRAESPADTRQLRLF
jgi:DNA polymerase-4